MPSPELAQREIEIRRRLRDDFCHYAAKALRIRTKAGEIAPLELNRAQQYIHEQIEQQRATLGRVRAIILKGRQQGCSTYVGARYYWRTTHRRGVRAFILTHEAESTAALFEMTERYHDLCPPLVKPSTGAASSRELHFDRLDSGYKVGTAGNRSVGRGTTAQYFHGSEVAFWPHAADHAKGVLQAIPDEPDTEVILESTANGLGNYFHRQWQAAERGESEYIPIFVPWYWQHEYRKAVIMEDFRLTDEEADLQSQYGLDDEQIMWRRIKVQDLSVDGSDGLAAFRQEYPMTSSEAFQASGADGLIKPEHVTAARKRTRDGSGYLQLGVDPARFGDDRTSIIRRRGSRAYGLESYSKLDTMGVVGIVNAIIARDKPAQVAIDVGGLGAGVYDRLVELGHKDILVAVDFGGKSLRPDRYTNKRAEMWGEMASWLKGDIPVDIPDSDSLQTDLCGPQYSYDSHSRLMIERKSAMKKRGLRSPDEGEALALTFAQPVRQKRAVPSITPVGDAIAGY